MKKGILKHFYLAMLSFMLVLIHAVSATAGCTIPPVPVVSAASATSCGGTMLNFASGGGSTTALILQIDDNPGFTSPTQMVHPPAATEICINQSGGATGTTLYWRISAVDCSGPCNCYSAYVVGDSVLIPPCGGNPPPPICTTQGIWGVLFDDQNSNCQYDIGESLFPGIRMNLYNSMNQLIDQTYTSLKGEYYFWRDTGTWTVKVDTSGLSLSSSCSQPGIDSTLTLTSSQPIVLNVNFPMDCDTVTDLAAFNIFSSGSFFPGQTHRVWLNAGPSWWRYGNQCKFTSNLSGTITLQFSGPVTYAGIATATVNPVVNGNSLEWTVSDFSLFNLAQIRSVYFLVDSTAVSSDVVCMQLVIKANGDAYPANDSLEFCYDVFNSYDPNYKEVYPAQAQPGFQDWITYTVHFQNTGTAPAFQVRITDTLSSKLDWSSLELMAASHEVRLSNTGGKIQARFDNIMLPDSLSDPEGSQGFVQFRVKPLAALIEGDNIPNTAAIYFDFNAPVITNTAITEVKSAAGLEQVSQDVFRLYPNPTSGKVLLELRIPSATDCVISDQFGKIMQTEILNGTHQQLDLSTFAPGCYFVRIGESVQRLVIIH